MNIKNIFKKEYTVGLDIGSSSVKIAFFVDRPDGPFLLKTELAEIKKTADEESSEKELVSVLKHLFRSVDPKKSRIIVSVNCPNTALKKITTPYMPRSELREGIKLQAKNFFPFPIDESLIDFEITGDMMDKGVRKYEILPYRYHQKVYFYSGSGRY